jgi:hypothetical protein
LRRQRETASVTYRRLDGAYENRMTVGRLLELPLQIARYALGGNGAEAIQNTWLALSNRWPTSGAALQL